MIDHDVTRPVRFVDGRTLSHICQGRTQPRHDIWEAYHGPHKGEEVSMVFCWSCLTLFVREGSRDAYLAWVSDGKSLNQDGTLPPVSTDPLRGHGSGPDQHRKVRTETETVPTRGILLIDSDAINQDDKHRLERMGWTVIERKTGRMVQLLPSP